MGTARPTARRVRGPRASRLIVLDDRNLVLLLQIEETRSEFISTACPLLGAAPDPPHGTESHRMTPSVPALAHALWPAFWPTSGRCAPWCLVRVGPPPVVRVVVQHGADEGIQK